MPLGIIGGAVIGYAVGGTAMAALAGAGIGSMAISALDSHGNSSTASGEQQAVFGEQQQYAQQLQQLIANPSSVSSLPGYQFQLGQGSTAVAQQMAASGYLGSGTEAMALDQFGQGLASNFYQQQAQLLALLSGLTAPSSPSQLGSVATSAQNNSFMQNMFLLGQLGQLAGKFSSAGTPAAAAGSGAADAAGIFAAG